MPDATRHVRPLSSPCAEDNLADAESLRALLAAGVLPVESLRVDIGDLFLDGLRCRRNVSEKRSDRGAARHRKEQQR